MVACGTCGRDNPSDARFCNGCGGALAPPASRREERKIVTVLFADLVGFTARAQRLDPEDVGALLAPYWAHVRDELERFGGTVEKFIGDAVMALFGAPAAHEDDPLRAVTAALALRDWVRENEDHLQLRIAVSTGEALVFLGAQPQRGEGMAAGDVVNSAARLQVAAPVNGVLVGESTYRMTRHAIEYREHPPVVAKGKIDPMATWEAVRVRSPSGREQTSTSPFVGRREELDLLVHALNRARQEREPQLVTVVGVPGIGKSRLVGELESLDAADEQRAEWRHGRSLPYGKGISLWALGEIVKSELGVLESDSRDETVAKLAVSLVELTDDSDERIWLERHLGPLVGLPAHTDDRTERSGAWRRWIEALAERRPLVLVFEDLQWADDALLDFVDELSAWIVDVPLLIVCTTRPELFERRPGWGGGKRNAITVSLGPLEENDTARIVSATLGRGLLPAEVQSAVLARAEGNPLYAEQYGRMLVESGSLAAAVPETVQGIVAARIDLLAPVEKSLLQDASVIGRVFWAGVLEGGAPTDALLRALVRREFLRREHGSLLAGEQQYAFAHALVRDVAYAQIPRTERAAKHLAAAEWIETLPADRAADRAEMAAHHYAAALELMEVAGIETAAVSQRAWPSFRAAADHAAALNRFPAADHWYSASLEHLSEVGLDRARLLLSRSTVRLWSTADAVADAEEAAALLGAAGDPGGSAEAELAAATARWFDGDGTEGRAHAERAHRLVADAPPSRVKAEVLVERARLLLLAGSFEEARELASAGAGLSRELGLERLEASALITRGIANAAGGAEAERDLRAAIEIGERLKDVRQLYRGLNALAEHVLRNGDLGAAAAIYTRIRDDVTRVGLDGHQRWLDGQECVLRLELGEWDRAVELAEALIVDLDAGRPHYLAATAVAIRALVRDARDGDADADVRRAETLARRVADPQVAAPVLGVCAQLVARRGDRAAARRLFDDALASMAAAPGFPYWWSSSLLWAAVELEATKELRPLLVAMVPSPWREAGLAVCDGDFAAAAGLFERIGARTCEACARSEAAVQGADAESERAVAFYRSVGAASRLRTLGPALAVSA
jgi:class 3 adenylate cyclase